MKKLSLLLLSLILCAQAASAASSSFKSSTAKADANAGWKTANDYLIGKNILPPVQGDPVITRAELAQALVAVTGNVVDQAGYSNCYSDVHEEEFAPAACFAAKQKWIDADKNKKFNPTAPATFGVALQAVIRSARFPAVAGRGSWFVPFVNAAIKQGIIDKADYSKQIDQSLTRSQLATMLYRLLLELKQVSVPVGALCIPSVPVSVAVVDTGTSSLPDSSIVVSDGKGTTCTVAHDPLVRSDAKHPNLRLVPLVPGSATANTGDSTPLVEKRAYFLSVDGDKWSPYVWELDLKKGHLRQLLNAETPAAIRLSPRYTFLSYVGSKGVDLRAMYLKTGLSKSIRLLSTQITFLKSLTAARNVAVTDHMLIDDNEALTFNIYNMRDGSLFQGKIRAQLDVLFNVRPGK